jgi:hypothetical protein
MDVDEFDRITSSAPTPGDRLAWYGALLARESRTPVEIVGGSAIEIYLTSAKYISQDVKVVGRKDPIARVLRRWGFRQVPGRSQRAYWVKETIGLVDLVGPGDRSGLAPHRTETPFGPVLLSRLEPLIIGRLSRAAREKSNELLRQAESLANAGDLDWEYLEVMARYEGVLPALRKLRKVAPKQPRPPYTPRPANRAGNEAG